MMIASAVGGAIAVGSNFVVPQEPVQARRMAPTFAVKPPRMAPIFG